MAYSGKKDRLFDVTHVLSLLTLVVFIGVVFVEVTPIVAIVAVLFLALAVAMSVHHAEVIAHRVGPSLGALILALAVTVIEVGLIVSMMMNDTPDSVVVARDTVFSAVIIVTNGIVGTALLLGGIRYKELDFHVEGSSSLLAVLATLVGLTLILPNYTTTTPGPTYSTSQLIFASITCVILYMALVVSQTITHKDYFDPISPAEEKNLEEAQYIPSKAATILSAIGLIVTLCVVIGLSKTLSPSIESGVAAMGAPRTVVGIIIALLVLLPETGAALAAARANRLQTSLNLALGSGAASIALTVPVVSVFAILTNRNLALGLDAKGAAFVLITFIVGGLTLGTGKASALKGIVHIVILFAYLALSFVP